MRKWWNVLIVICLNCLFFMHLIVAQESDLLKVSDIHRVMQQILNQHVEKNQLTGQIFQNAINLYIDQFDPNRIYLLQEEVEPFQNLSQARLQELIDQYENSGLEIFKQLNEVMQHAILRSRELRPQIEAEAKKTLFDLRTPKKNQEAEEHTPLKFAKNVEQLKEHIFLNLKTFIEAQQQRYSDAIIAQRKDQTIQAYETILREVENQYLYQNEKGELLSIPERENLFAIHVLKALASSLDAHTSFFGTNEAYELRVRLQKEFQGIGLILRDEKGKSVVSRLLQGAPAAKSGQIQPGDILIEIDGKSVIGHTFDKVMEILHEGKGPNVSLMFERPNGENRQVFTVNLERQLIVLNSGRVNTSYENFGNGIIGVITLHSFYQGDGVSSEKDMREAIANLRKKGPIKGLILDLRDNGGGFLSQAVKVAGLFIKSGVIVISKYASGDERIYRDVDSKIAYDGPLIVLTSKVTASAAEIVAQALQDYGVALIVGDEHTYGKGTIQTQTVTDNQSTSYFKVTVGKYYTVSGRTPQKRGVKADVLVPSHWSQELIGEEYLDTVKADTIAPLYNDSLEDVPPDMRGWYLKYYIPKLQKKESNWRHMIPILRKNSEHRIANNKNYQLYLKGEISKESEEEGESDIDILGKRKKDFGVDDLQIEEAKNVLKDMVLLQSLEEPDKSEQKEDHPES